MMVINWCNKCNGFGHVRIGRWWKFSRELCDACGGDGFAKPPGWPDRKEMARLRPSPPGPPPKPKPSQIVYSVTIDELAELVRAVK